MTRLRRSFTAEFKLEAACLVLVQGLCSPRNQLFTTGRRNCTSSMGSTASIRTKWYSPNIKALISEQQSIQELEVRIS